MEAAWGLYLVLNNLVGVLVLDLAYLKYEGVAARSMQFLYIIHIQNVIQSLQGIF